MKTLFQLEQPHPPFKPEMPRMFRKHASFMLLVFSIFISGCVVDPRRDLAQFGALIVKQNESDYLKCAQEFIACAQRAEVEKMIHLTSPMTLANSGATRVKEIYTTQVIPAFRSVDVRWNSSGKLILDETYNVGLTLSGKVVGQKTTPLYVDVFKEGKRLVVVHVRTTPNPSKR